jgi:hypothetical protein
LPLEAILREHAAQFSFRTVVIDGAQEFCHVSTDLSTEYCDLYLASSHKWLGAHHPLGLGFYGRRRSVPVIETLLAHLVETGALDDPLLKFTGQLEGHALDSPMETVNLTPLFSCQGAVEDALNSSLAPTSYFPSRLANLRTTGAAAETAGWEPLLTDPAMQSGILLLRAERSETRSRTAAHLRHAFGEEGVALTAYDEGLVRLSMPDTPWVDRDFELLKTALRKIA